MMLASAGKSEPSGGSADSPARIKVNFISYNCSYQHEEEDNNDGQGDHGDHDDDDGSGDDKDSNSTVNAEENNESWESKIFQQREVF